MLRVLRYSFLLTVALAAIALGAVFSLQNSQPIPLDLLIFQFSPQSAAIWILLAFGLGVTLGVGAGTAMAISRLATIRGLRRERDRLSAQVALEKVGEGDE